MILFFFIKRLEPKESFDGITTILKAYRTSKDCKLGLIWWDIKRKTSLNLKFLRMNKGGIVDHLNEKENKSYNNIQNYKM